MLILNLFGKMFKNIIAIVLMNLTQININNTLLRIIDTKFMI